MRDARLEANWNKELEWENGRHLPDCRTRNWRDRVWRAGMWWDKVYCANCGKPDGLVTSDWTPHVFALCDACVSVGGQPAGVTRLDEGAERIARGQSCADA